nr:hypothetical protein [uncultured Flavobacterium sp.]
MKISSIKVIVILLVISFGSYYLYNYVLYKEGRNIHEEKPAYSVSASDFIEEYFAEVLKAESKYLNKTISIEGNVTEVSDSTLVLDSKIFCQMDEKVNRNSLNKRLTIKGRCIGYDDLFEVVKFDQCSQQ